jgi:hypothetical protein
VAGSTGAPSDVTDDTETVDQEDAWAGHDQEGTSLGALPGLDRVRHLFGRKRE